MKRITWLSIVIVGTLLAIGCCHLQERTHNPVGGYIEACGELPPVLGDDC